jgi:hypothetical protein
MIRETLLATCMLTQVAPAGSTSTSMPVSPSVMATVMGVMNQDGRGEIELLVLWRGTPGWVLRNSGGGSSSGGGGTMGAAPGEITRSAWISRGGVNLHVRFEPKSRKLWIQDREVALNDDNVVLVDDVDSVIGAQVARTLRVDPAFTPVSRPSLQGYPARQGARPMVMMPPPQEFIRRSPELVEFLRCDVVPPGLSAYEQQVLEMWCSAVKQP